MKDRSLLFKKNVSDGGTSWYVATLLRGFQA